MPAELDSCVQKVIAQGKTKSEAFAICNESLNASVEIEDKDDHLWLRAFLLDSSTNLNSWGVSKDTLDQNIKTYIGKPLVVQEDFNHPDSGDPNYDHHLQYQEKFRIGNITAIAEKDGIYSAIIDVTDPTAKQAFRTGDLPLYVSPQLFHDGVGSEPDDAARTWRGTHLAVVKEPAFGVKKARITGQCNGHADTCMAQLKRASCNFCIKRTVENYKSANPEKPKIIVNIDGKEFKRLVSNKPTQSNSSLEKNNRNINSKLSEVKEDIKQISPDEFEKLKKANQDLAEENKNLKTTLESKETVISGLTKNNDDLTNRVSAIEKSARTKDVANVLSAVKFETEEERQKRIATLVDSNLKIEDIKETYQPLISATKSASVTKLPQKSASSEDSQLSSWARLQLAGGNA